MIKLRSVLEGIVAVSLTAATILGHWSAKESQASHQSTMDEYTKAIIECYKECK